MSFIVFLFLVQSIIITAIPIIPKYMSYCWWSCYLQTVNIVSIAVQWCMNLLFSLRKLKHSLYMLFIYTCPLKLSCWYNFITTMKGHYNTTVLWRCMHKCSFQIDISSLKLVKYIGYICVEISISKYESSAQLIDSEGTRLFLWIIRTINYISVYNLVSEEYSP